MEGTSGVVERMLLRGSTREAPLLRGERKRGSKRVPRAKAGESLADSNERLGSPAKEVPSSRQEVSETIGLGRSSLRAQARREALRTEARALVQVSP